MFSDLFCVKIAYQGASEAIDEAARLSEDALAMLTMSNMEKKLQYSTFSECKPIDERGNMIRHRHHCDEGIFTVEVHA